MTSLEVGCLAPDFTLPASNGKQVSLSDFRGQNVILYFYPKDNTPGCSQQACDFRDNLTGFTEADAVVLGVSLNDLKSHDKFIKKYDLPFILLADTEHEVSEKYDVYKLKKMCGREYMGIERTTFMINREGTLVNAWRKVKVKGHSDEVLDYIQHHLK